MKPLKEKQPKQKESERTKLKGVCYFLYYYFLYYEPTATIVINQNLKKLSKKSNNIPNYACDCILRNEKCIYEMGMEYQAVFDETLKIKTVEYDKSNQLPISFIPKRYKDLMEFNRRIFQQHILFHEINNRLKEFNQELILKPRNQLKSKTIPSLQLETHVTYFEGGMKETPLEVFKKFYQNIVTIMCKLFDRYLKKENNVIEILVLGDSIKNTGININTDKFCQITRNNFLTLVSNELQLLQLQDLYQLPLPEKDQLLSNTSSLSQLQNYQQLSYSSPSQITQININEQQEEKEETMYGQ